MKRLFLVSLILLINIRLTKECIPETTLKAAPIKLKYQEIQTEASWYGPGFQGRKMANGEIFNQNDLVAASPTLPFGTKVKITNISNSKSITVIIKDRGPYKMDRNGKVIRPLKPHPKRGFDLSKGAFSRIAPLKKGIIKIKATVLISDFS